MNTVNPGLRDYLRSETRVPFLFKKRTLLRPYLFLFDALVVFAAFLLAYALRFDFNLSSFDFGVFLLQSLLVLLVYLGSEAVFKSFAGLSNSTVFQNIIGVLMSATLSLAVLWFIVFLVPEQGWFQKWVNIPKSILVIHYFLSIVLLILIRLCCRTKL
jgi:FlaA1/EpsC-like NDP-sugar epimerase